MTFEVGNLGIASATIVLLELFLGDLDLFLSDVLGRLHLGEDLGIGHGLSVKVVGSVTPSLTSSVSSVVISVVTASSVASVVVLLLKFFWSNFHVLGSRFRNLFNILTEEFSVAHDFDLVEIVGLHVSISVADGTCSL
jgi:hypothetical protein